MTYTPNIPQATQTIAFTQPLLQANNNFLQAAIGQEHNFNASDATQTFHSQASMPNMLFTPGSLPSGTNGIYFVRANLAKFYDGTDEYTMSIWRTNKGTFTLGNNGVDVTIVAAVPSNTFGVIYMYSASSPKLAMSGQYIADGAKIRGFSNKIYNSSGDSSNDSPIRLNGDPGSNNTLIGQASSNTYEDDTYTFFLLYRPM